MAAFARTEVGGRLLARGDLAAACGVLGQVVATWHRSGDWSQLWLTMTHSAQALNDLGEDELAAQVIGSTDHHASYAAVPLSVPLREAAIAAADDLRSRLGDDRYEQLLREGAALPVSDVVHRAGTALLTPRA